MLLANVQMWPAPIAIILLLADWAPAWRMILTVDCGMFCETIKAFRFNGAVTQLWGRQLQFVSVKRS